MRVALYNLAWYIWDEPLLKQANDNGCDRLYFTYKEYGILNICGKMYVPFIRVVYFIRPPQLAEAFFE